MKNERINKERILTDSFEVALSRDGLPQSKIEGRLKSLSRKELENEYIKLSTELMSANATLNWYKEQYELSKMKRFGKSSESDIAGQMSMEDMLLFNEAEALREPINIEPSKEDIIPSDNKSNKKSSKKKNIKSLPVYEEIFELSEEEKVCDKCGSPLHEIKEEVHVEIEVIPAKVQAHKYVSKIYACRNCEKNGTSNIIKAPGCPAPMIPKSVCSPSLAADFLSQKYEKAVPFYRQEQAYKNRLIPITRNNMCNWTIKIANDYFKPIFNLMRDELYKEHVIHCDETYVEVLREPDRPAYRKSYVWVTTSAKYLDKKIALYNYTESRSQTDARKVLKGYSGYIMCDGYGVYDAITKKGKNNEEPMNVKPVACLVHIRRKFVEALKLIKPNERSDTSAQTAINKIAEIFRIDNKLNDFSIEDRHIERQSTLKRALLDFFEWVKSEYDVALPKSKYGQAVSYALEQKDKVMRVLEDGRLELENNMAERAVKPFVIGRKNWMFSNTPAGAEASCIIYSIVESAKLNDLIPYEYLKYLLETMSDLRLTDDNIKKLLPWSEEIPSYIKRPSEE